MKRYGSFGYGLENYQAPANRTSGNQPKFDFAAGLQSARQALDGKQMEKRGKPKHNPQRKSAEKSQQTQVGLGQAQA
ncbi:MAG: hypothetical protein SR3Q1_10560 [Quinella sp. 3Q1]|nr:hypothetical protein [Quinella sp. 3Q1]MBR3049981.1 hypothetical protein [Selenomonadaceae bacterium]MBR6888303.1 hypothetical protein [Selenomonadaceae bacterium]